MAGDVNIQNVAELNKTAFINSHKYLMPRGLAQEIIYHMGRIFYKAATLCIRRLRRGINVRDQARSARARFSRPIFRVLCKELFSQLGFFSKFRTKSEISSES